MKPETTAPAEALSVIRKPPSVFRSDAEALRTLLWLHAVERPDILDATFNTGRIWRGTEYRPHRMDRSEKLYEQGAIDTLADFRKMPFDDASWDVIVWDPPHVTDAGRSGVIGSDDGWGERFGLADDELKGKNISPLFAPFLAEAKRVLVPETGIAIVKIADMVHAAAMQWQHCLLWQAALEAEMTPCDLGMTITYSRAGFVDPRWKHIYHLRGIHCFWMVIRNGKDACLNPHAPVVRRVETIPLFETQQEAIA